METHPRTYVQAFRSCQHEQRPAQEGDVRAYSNITLVLEPMADGSTQAEYGVESDLLFADMPFWLSKLAGERNGSLLNEYAIDLKKERQHRRGGGQVSTGGGGERSEQCG